VPVSAEIRRVVDQLTERFPNCFRPNGEQKRPLKIGIRDDILAAMPEVDPKKLSAALAHYVRRKSYTCRMKPGSPRYGLDGEVCGVVELMHAGGRKDPAPKPRLSASGRPILTLRKAAA